MIEENLSICLNQEFNKFQKDKITAFKNKYFDVNLSKFLGQNFIHHFNY